MNERRADIHAGAGLVIVVALAAACTGHVERSAQKSAEAVPDGYQVVLDRADRTAADFRVQVSPTGLRLNTAAAGIVFRPGDRVEEGPYSVSAVFTEVAARQGHREGYGLFVGGSDLSGPGQRYTYFLVRGDGRYLIKTRSANLTRDLSDEWVSSEAVSLAANADTTNALSIHVAEGRLRFHCNGKQVAELPEKGLVPHGVAGIRVNHHLDVVVRDFRIDQ